MTATRSCAGRDAVTLNNPSTQRPARPKVLRGVFCFAQARSWFFFSERNAG